MNDKERQLAEEILKGIEDIKLGNEKLNSQYDRIENKTNQNLDKMTKINEEMDKTLNQMKNTLKFSNTKI
ncbi:hypothetical protein [Priestia endophytica]|uniref:hypothetical protein n=1 Tax=Priestia endophytica TaxID=135735 RepID=UPI000DCA9195|nr:hypothetical protein [Priestia endophytica]RAS73225.1 hypothetical protein A4R27_24875 [Priestia endophytica]